MIQIQDKRECCGCTACASICNHEAILMQVDEMGFKYPVVDIAKCVECGLCEKVCAFHEHYDTTSNFQEPFVYAVRHKNNNEIKTSRSGAMFTALSDFIFERKGIVYGVGFADHFRVVHKRITNREDCKDLKGSKYVQSDLADVFRSVKKDLVDGFPVLFSGTPCQTSGLHSFLGKKEWENLYLCDIVCHGVPSPKVWADYLEYVETKENRLIEKVNFRDKERGWKAHFESFVFQGGKKIITRTFTDLFYKHLILRPSCSSCKFTNTRRPSDITIADFWGWEKAVPGFNDDDLGCSLVFVNTPKGDQLFKRILPEIHAIQTDLAHCMQPNLEHPSVFSPKYDSFWKDYQRQGFDFVVKKYGDKGFRHKISQFKSKVKRIIKYCIK